MITEFRFGCQTDAMSVMVAAAQRFIDRGEPIWEMSELTPECLFSHCDSQSIIVGYVDGDPAAAMLLTWYDPEFWPHIPPNTSAFIHKLSVHPRYKGSGLSTEMLESAAAQAKQAGLSWLRLDCPPGRHKLRSLYERHDFVQVGERLVGPDPSVFFEKRI